MTRVLLVEDNELNRDMLSRRLQRRGFEVMIAADGEQGVAAQGRIGYPAHPHHRPHGARDGGRSGQMPRGGMR
jgi:hypothetical protein